MNGIINVLKPPGMTSQNVVSFMRRMSGIKKIGHSGTLDPYAAGVLPIFIGKATRLVEYAMQGQKEYIGEIYFGLETDTLDSQGKVISRQSGEITKEQFQSELESTKVTIYQRPPMYSALKKDGRKLVDLARKGKSVDIPKRPVEIYETEFLEQTETNRFLFRVRCSKGTYVRTLCQDWGKMLGTVAHLSFLLRTQTGGFRIEESVTLEEIEHAFHTDAVYAILQPMESGCIEMERIYLSGIAKRAVLCGQPIDPAWIQEVPKAFERPCQLWVNDVFLGIAKRTQTGVQTVKVIWEEPCNE